MIAFSLFLTETSQRCAESITQWSEPGSRSGKAEELLVVSNLFHSKDVRRERKRHLPLALNECIFFQYLQTKCLASLQRASEVRLLVPDFWSVMSLTIAPSNFLFVTKGNLNFFKTLNSFTHPLAFQHLCSINIPGHDSFVLLELLHRAARIPVLYSVH